MRTGRSEREASLGIAVAAGGVFRIRPMQLIFVCARTLYRTHAYACCVAFYAQVRTDSRCSPACENPAPLLILCIAPYVLVYVVALYPRVKVHCTTDPVTHSYQVKSSRRSDPDRVLGFESAFPDQYRVSDTYWEIACSTGYQP